jgi:regulator of vacuolar morphogenesis
MSHTPDKRKPSYSIPGGTPYKRSRVSYADDDNEDHASQSSAAAMTHERPRNNPLYGQKSAFPGLDVDAEGELFYGPAEDGLEYLRMVR